MSEPSTRSTNLSPQEKRALVSQLLRHQSRSTGPDLPPSYGQQALWLTHQLAPQSWAYNVLFTARVRSPVHPLALHRALQTLVSRHPILRTTYHAHQGRLTQHLHEHLPVSFSVINAATWEEAALRQHLLAAARQPFDLEHGPLLRVALFTRTATDHVLLLVVHHIAIDMWSLGLLLEELRTLYAAATAGREASLPALDRHYSDFVRWQTALLGSADGERLWAYWQQQLAGELPVLELPTDRPRPPLQTYVGATHTFALPAALTEQLKALARAEGTTLFMTLLAAFYVLLHRYTNQDDLLVGTFTADRVRPEFRRIVGYFVNPVVLRASLAGNPTFQTFLGQVRHTVLAAIQHQDFPFPLLVERLHPTRHANRSPLFQAAFVLQQLPGQAELLQCFLPGASGVQVDFGGLRLEPLALPQQEGQFDLTLEMAEVQGTLWGEWKYNTDLFEAPTIERLAAHFQTLLAGIVDQIEQPIATLPLLTAAQRQQVLLVWNDTRQPYPLERCLHEWVEEQVERTPHAPAVLYEGQQLTYQELNRRANQLAHYLRALGVGPEVLVGICVERSLEMVIGLLAILKAGGAYVPLDPTYPVERLAFMLEDTQTPVLLTQQRLTATLPAHPGTTLCLDTDWERVRQESIENPCQQTSAEHCAYVIYTSGSTGKPKGVMIPHRGICNRLLWMQEAYQLTSADRVLQKTPFSFDVSVWEFFWPLMTGACLVVARPGGHQDSTYLVEMLATQQITTVHFVPSMLRVFLEEQGLETCRSLKRVLCSGEALPVDLQERFFARLDAALHNLYGPTEASVDVTFWACQRHQTRPSVPIGYPIANTCMYILDPYLQPVPPGVAGELHIGGVGLARGYLNRPELSAEKFITHPFDDEPGARLYKTGDLGRYLPDGSIEFLGRLDQQVKIRGFRIELEEIETVLRQHSAVRDAVVSVRDDPPGAQRLVAYLAIHAGTIFTISHLRQFLAAKLPDYMLPAALVQLESIPLSPNGKVDRRALPAPDRLRPELLQPLVVPQTPLENLLAGLWSRVLGVEHIGIYDNFFDLGGDSIRALQVRTYAQEAELGLSVDDLYRYPTLHELAHNLGRTDPAVAPPLRTAAFSLLAAADRQQLPDTIVDAYPLAALQAGMLFHSMWSANSATYHDVFSFHLQLPYDELALHRAVEQLAARHAVLRTSFGLTRYGEPLQLVHRQVQIPIRVEDWRQYPPEEQEAMLAAWKVSERRQSFDYTLAPLWRVFIHRRSTATWQFTLSFHHAILDGWSVASLLTEFFGRYLSILRQEPETLEPLPAASYRDFIALERTTLQSQAAADYWQQTLRDCTIVTLPGGADRPLASRQPETGVLQVAIDTPTSAGLYRLARTANVPIKSVLLAAHLRVMRLLSGHADVLTGVVSHGRPEERDGERILGLFLNTLPFRLRLAGGSWLDLVQQTFAAERAAFPFRRYPLAELQRRHGGQALFQVVFDYTHFHVYQQLQAYKELEVLGTDIFEQTNFPLYVRFAQEVAAARLTLALHYDGSQLSPEQMQAISGYYATTLQEMACHPTQSYMAASILAPGEQERLLYKWNRTAMDYPQDACIHDLFTAQAARTPEAIAVRSAQEQLTYRELNQRANQLAHYLRRLGVGPEVLVGLCIERSLDMVVGLLGILKAGGAYVPLDPAYPRERLAFMLTDAQVSILVTQTRLLAALPTPGGRVVCLDADNAEVLQESQENPVSGTTPESLAYVLYTSGSTGTPKGVLGLHRGAVNRFAWMWATYPFTAADVCCQKTSLNFVDSVWELFGPLLQGIPTVIIPSDVLSDPQRLVQTLAASQITRLVLVPSLLSAILDTVADLQHRLPALRLWICSGEALSLELCQRFQQCLPAATLLNLYGSSEVAADVTWYDTRSMSTALRSVPIGRPIANTQIYLLDDHLHPVPVGVAGELYAGGAGLARGYLRRPELTAERFITNPFHQAPAARLYKTGDLARYLSDGQIEFLGRRDHQVKIRGYRIEPGEIETALSQHPAVRDAVVMARPEAPGAQRLVAYLVPQQEPVPALDDLRRWVRQKLPEYMVPAAFVWLECLPLTPNGKVDRLALPEAESRPASRPIVAPRTAVETALAEIWEQLLGLTQVSIHDNFFELGGHSLLAVQLMSRIRQTLAQDLPISTLLQAPTIAELALCLLSPVDTGLLVPVQPHGSHPPLFCLHPAGGQIMVYQALAASLGTEQPLYGVQSRVLTGTAAEHHSIDAMAVDYAAAIRQHQPVGPYYILGWSLGGILALAVARVLESQGQRLAFVGLLDPPLASDPPPSWEEATLLGSVQALGSNVASALAALAPDLQQTLRNQFLTSPPTERFASLLRWAQERQLLAQHLQLESLQQHAVLAATHIRMLHTHQILPLQAPLCVWWAGDGQPAGQAPPDWQPYTAGITYTESAAGNHFSMLQWPHVQQLAERLRVCLQIARQAVTAEASGRRETADACG